MAQHVVLPVPLWLAGAIRPGLQTLIRVFQRLRLVRPGKLKCLCGIRGTALLSLLLILLLRRARAEWLLQVLSSERHSPRTRLQQRPTQRDLFPCGMPVKKHSTCLLPETWSGAAPLLQLRRRGAESALLGTAASLLPLLNLLSSSSPELQAAACGNE